MTTINTALIIADMEGVTGIDSKYNIFSKTSKPVEKGRRAMEKDVATVIKGLATIGVHKVYVADWHDTSKNIREKNIQYDNVHIQIFRTSLVDILKKVGSKIDGAIFVGFHAKAGDKAFLAHTYCFSVKNVYFDGTPKGEIALNTLALSYYNIPTLLAVGAEEAVREAKQLNKKTIIVSTKKKYTARSSKKVYKEIMQACKRIPLINIQSKKYNPTIRLELTNGKTFSYKKKNSLESYKQFEHLIDTHCKKEFRKNNEFILQDENIR